MINTKHNINDVKYSKKYHTDYWLCVNKQDDQNAYYKNGGN